VLFPNLDRLGVEGIHNQLLQEAIGAAAASGHSAAVAAAETAAATCLAAHVVRLRIQRCPLAELLARQWPRLRSLELTYCPSPPPTNLLSNLLDQLSVLRLTRDEYRDSVEYPDLRALLHATRQLREFQLANASVYVSGWQQQDGAEGAVAAVRRRMTDEEFLGKLANFVVVGLI
jgi:hypothetical protein